MSQTSPHASQKTEIAYVPLGQMDYQEALDTQNRFARALLNEEDQQQRVLFVEHPPTITMGRNGTADHIVMPTAFLQERGFSVYEVDRGGDVTYHGPGQLVVYPILHLATWGNDVGRYVRMLEEVVIRSLAEVGIQGERLEGYPGVWVGDEKVCAIGASVKKRKSGEFVTSHGLALNVCPDLTHFQTIIPCGIADKGVTSIERLQAGEAAHEREDADATLAVWEERVLRQFLQVFDATPAGV